MIILIIHVTIIMSITTFLSFNLFSILFHCLHLLSLLSSISMIHLYQFYPHLNSTLILIIRQHLLIPDRIKTLLIFGLIPPINDTDAPIVLHKPESKFNIPSPHDNISSIDDTLLLTNYSHLTVVSTPLLLIFDKRNVRKRHVYAI